MIKLFDTTLRDGTQAEGISFTVDDKLHIASLLDEVGIHYIEGGWPGSNPKDLEFFAAVKQLPLQHAKITAFGATRRVKFSCEQDSSIQALIRSEAPVACVFGKSWNMHVESALNISLSQNLEIIEDTVRYLHGYFDEVIFDAEHFFDGYAADPDYALQCLRAAVSGGADYLTLCDTNGGSLPWELATVVAAVAQQFSVPLGIHTHNDSETAVANSLAAVSHGVTLVQGTINGIGERCGNANLISIIPGIQLKLG